MNDFKAFVDSKDIEKIEEFYENGFYIADTMFVMEMENLDSLNLDETVFCIDSGEISIYDAEDKTEYLKANKKGFGVAESLEELNEKLSNEDSRIYVLRKNGAIKSSVTVWKHSDFVLATESIFTIPREREKGYAKKVLLYALSLAKEKGYKKARLTVYASDIAAINFYKKIGYSITKVLQEFRHE